MTIQTSHVLLTAGGEGWSRTGSWLNQSRSEQVTSKNRPSRWKRSGVLASAVKALSTLALLALAAGQTYAQGTPLTGADVYSHSRSSSFTYYANGLLQSEVIEPGQANLCVVTTYTYDAYGNKSKASTSNTNADALAAGCSGANAMAQFADRATNVNTLASALGTPPVTVGGQPVAIQDGQFALTVANALSQSETKTYDPRFGAVLKLVGPNNLPTSWVVDDFGRKTRETRADNTSSVMAYCFLSTSGLDTSSNSAQCSGLSFASGEVPTDAISFVHSEPHDANDLKSGPFSRVYMDRAGRKLRTVTEAFDGVNQGGGQARLIVQDVDYNVYGIQIVTTQPYFLDSNTSTTSGAHYGMSTTEYDVLGRPVKVYSSDISSANNAGGSTSTTFGNRGTFQASVTTISYAGLVITTTNDKNQSRVEEKNADGKLVRITDANGAQVAHQHDAFGDLVETKDALQNKVSIQYDTRGRKVAMTDPDSGAWSYDYSALGELKWQQNANQKIAGTATTMAYDQLGRMIQRVDPEYTSTWSYDTCSTGVGKLCATSTSHGVARKLAYDVLGRPTSTRTDITAGTGFASSQSFASAVSYDATTGRLASQTYPSGLQVGYNYTTKGFLQSLVTGSQTTITLNPLPASAGGTPVASQTLSPGTALWTAQSYNAWGQAEQTLLGNGVAPKASFDPATGRLISNTAGVGSATDVVNQNYVWDSLGHLTQRVDHNGDLQFNTGAVQDDFLYDSLGRLSSYTVSASQIPNLSRNVTLQYNALGMLLYKSDVGAYSYLGQGPMAVQPHALQSVVGSLNASFTFDANGNLQTASTGSYRSVSYTSFNLPDSQTGVQGPGANGTAPSPTNPGSPKYTWQYDENHQRIMEVRTVASGPNAGTRTTWMMHPDNQGGLGFEYEIAPNGITSNRHYLSVGGASIGVLVTTSALPTLRAGQLSPDVITTTIIAVKLEYWHKDHLGSLVATTDHLGNVTARYAYDPFGKRRMVNGQYDAFGTLIIDWNTSTSNGTDRGFTGHEHLDDIGIIHMNGRLFDPTLGVFLQADPMVQDPSNLQNFNRYGYCFNNPLTCTDPTGHFNLRKFLGSVVAGGIIDFFVPGLGSLISGIYQARMIAHSQLGYQIGSIVISIVSTAYCEGGAAACNAIGQAAWSALAGHGIEASIKVGVFAYVSAQVNGQIHIGTEGSPFANVVAHTAWGCAESSMQGGSCKSGAVSGGISAAWTNSGWGNVGDAKHNMGDLVLNTMTNAVVGGVASVASGGSFAMGARSAAMSYLFNAMAGRFIGQRIGMWGGAALCSETGPGAALCAVGGRWLGGTVGSWVEDRFVGALATSGGEGADKLARYDGPKPEYDVNDAHLPGGNPNKTPQPEDAESVYQRAVPDAAENARNWYGKNADGVTYRYSNSGDGTVHFSGRSDVFPGIRNITRYAIDRLGAL